MKTQASVLGMILGFGMIAGTASAQTGTSAPGFLADYNYQVAQLSSVSAAQSLMNFESTETRNKSICANRAAVWSFIMRKERNVQVGKVFIHFTKDGQANENKQWSYHVAPYVIVNGEEMVLDSAFSEFNGAPTKLSNWTNYFGKSQNCVVLDPTHNPQHLKYEQNNLPNDFVTPLTYTRGGARQYPTTEGICYIRKVPMYYSFPIEVYGADLALTGKTEYSSYLKQDFVKQDMIDSCKQAMTPAFRRDQSCESYLGF